MRIPAVSKNMPVQTHNEPLDNLAELCGIVPEYTDVFGTKRVTSQETKKAILKAMHLTVDTPGAVQQATDVRRVKQWKQMLAPAMVFSVNEQPITIPVHLPADEGQEQNLFISWTLTDEQGQKKAFSAIGSEVTMAEQQWIDGKLYVRLDLSPDTVLAMGYYALSVVFTDTGTGETRDAAATIIVTPDTCYIPPELRTGQAWGLSINLYAIRSARNWGIGDFTDLKRIITWIADAGGSFVGINPLHAIANRKPFDISPYSPISRLYKNFIYIDVEQVEDAKNAKAAQDIMGSASFQAELHALRQRDLIDYETIAARKEQILRHAFAFFYENHHQKQTRRDRAFQQYRTDEGEALEFFALFMALREHMSASKDVYTWQDWPEEYQDHRGRAVHEFKGTKEKEILYQSYVQWIASTQLREISEECGRSGMTIGLYHDLAIGSIGGGSDAWNYREMLGDAGVGAPPDRFNPVGQNWGFPPMIPEKLKEAGYALFIETVRENMKHGGALRIDHALSLFRLFWIPHGTSPHDGAYVGYPSEDLLRIAALESIRSRCMVIAEDLGTVPKDVKKELQKYQMLSYRLLYFERNYPDPSFVPPEHYPAMALCAVTTHDLPTLAGYWVGRDIKTRKELGKYPDVAAYLQQQSERQRDKARVLSILKSRSLLPGEFPGDPDRVPAMTPELGIAIYRYLASTPCKLLNISLDDMLGTIDQQNIPGTVDEYPNWTQKTPLALEEMVSDRRFAGMFSMLKKSFP